MPGIITIRIKAFLLTAIFAGNFLVVCHCSATAGACSDFAARQHCCCRQKTRPCREKSDCPGMRAVKFNLMEKKVAGPVHLNLVAAASDVRDYIVPVMEGRLTQRNYSSNYFYQHSPPDRLAFYHCFLI
jgi:hypothetical protein